MNEAGYVYIISEPSGLLKIGHAVCVKKRLSCLQTGSPHKLKVCNSFRCDNLQSAHRAERKTHRRLASARVRGEWFKVSVPVAIEAVTSAISGREPSLEPTEAAMADLAARSVDLRRKIKIVCACGRWRAMLKSAVQGKKLRCRRCGKAVPVPN